MENAGVNASRKFIAADTKPQPDRFLLIATSGGLNQQRTGIVDAIVAAYILNATLVKFQAGPKVFLERVNNFGEIFNVDRFISFLSRDVRILKHLPREEGKVLTPHNMRVPRKCTPHCYENRVIPVLKKKTAVQLTKFDYRLSNWLNADLQRLRCRVNYHALNFTDSISEI